MPGDVLDIITSDGASESASDDTVVRCAFDSYRLGDLRAAQRLDSVDVPGLAGAIAGSFVPSTGSTPDWFVLGLMEEPDGTIGTHVIGLIDDDVLLTGYVSLPDGWMIVRSQRVPDCDLRISPPEGLGAVDWVLESAEIDPASTAVTVLVTERGCAGGQPPGERLLGPDVFETADEVAIAFGVIPVGEATCPGTPPTPVVIELDAPIGTRPVVDGFFLGMTMTDVLGSSN